MFLSTYRLPNPNATEDGLSIFGSNFPSFKNREGLKTSGSGYISGSRVIDLPRRYGYTLYTPNQIGAYHIFCPIKRMSDLHILRNRRTHRDHHGAFRYKTPIILVVFEDRVWRI